jgi:histidyl-tRNA synthetase
MKLNDRKLLSAIGTYAGVAAEHLASMYRAIDKLEKVGRAAVTAELTAAGISEDAISRLFDLISLRGEPASVFAELRAKLGDNDRALEGIGDLEQIVACLDDLGVSREHFEVDLSMVRGLDYYTGPIFECIVEDMKIGSICGGGRYDNLVGMLSSQSLPAVGISVGLERIVDVLEALEMNKEGSKKTKTAVLVTVFAPETRAESLRLVSELRSEGISAEVALAGDRLPNQLKYASRKGIPYVAIVGPDEVANGKVVVKDMTTGEQRTYERSGIASVLLALVLA